MVSNIDKSTKKCILISKTKKTRKAIKEYEEKNDNFTSNNDYASDIDKLTKLYMKVDFDHNGLYQTYVRDKTKSYLYQDKKKNRNTLYNIDEDGVLEKLVASKLKCYYCQCKMVLINEKTRQSNMWT